MMNTKKIFKLLLDVTMLILYILLIFGYRIGPFFHEVVGIGIGTLFIAHVILNGKVIRGLARTALRRGSSAKAKLFFYTDCILSLSMLVTIISGIMISDVVFSFDFNSSILAMHNISAYVSLVILSGHALLHLRYIAGVIRNSSRQKPSGFARALRRYSAVVAIAVTAYVFSSSAFNGLSNDTTSNRTSLSDSETATSTENSTDTATQASGSSSEDDAPTLDEYLSNLYCTGCGRHCSLLSPQCGIGSAQSAAAQVDYNEEYA